MTPPTTGFGGEPVGLLPHLPPDFYASHPVLDHVRRAAYAQLNPPSPDATLAACLARVAALVPVESQLPERGTVNYLAALVGPPESGKTTAYHLARALIPHLGPTVLDSHDVGTGEGLVEGYLRREKDEHDNWTKVQARTAACYYVDEAEALLNRAKSEASTTLATLRSMWSGTDVGTMNAQVDTSRHLAAGTYRFSAVIGFQPRFAMHLIAADSAAGTPQRFLYASSRDPHVPDVGPSDPGPLSIVAPRPGAIRVDAEVSRIMRDRRVRVQRGELVVDEMDAHRHYLQLKTACLLSVLCGDGGAVSIPWWNLAARMVENSRSIIRALRDDALQAAQAEREARVEERIEAREMEDEKNLRRIGAQVFRYATDAAGPVTWGYLTRNALNSRDRNRFTAAEMVRAGFLRPADKNGHYLPGRVDVDKWTRP